VARKTPIPLPEKKYLVIPTPDSCGHGVVQAPDVKVWESIAESTTTRRTAWQLSSAGEPIRPGLDLRTSTVGELGKRPTSQMPSP
jgi:hypothetical protein